MRSRRGNDGKTPDDWTHRRVSDRLPACIADHADGREPFHRHRAGWPLATTTGITYTATMVLLAVKGATFFPPRASRRAEPPALPWQSALAMIERHYGHLIMNAARERLELVNLLRRAFG
jgi:hypothetical protein